MLPCGVMRGWLTADVDGAIPRMSKRDVAGRRLYNRTIRGKRSHGHVSFHLLPEVSD